MGFTENLKALRIKNNLSRKQLAEMLNINCRTYLSYEYGEREPRFKLLEELKKIFNCTFDDLLD